MNDNLVGGEVKGVGGVTQEVLVIATYSDDDELLGRCEDDAKMLLNHFPLKTSAENFQFRSRFPFLPFFLFPSRVCLILCNNINLIPSCRFCSPLSAHCFPSAGAVEIETKSRAEKGKDGNNSFLRSHFLWRFRILITIYFYLCRRKLSVTRLFTSQCR